MLHLKNIAHFYENKLVFKNISLDIFAGEILLLAGPNGAGKTTLLKIMAELVPPSTGTVEWDEPSSGTEASIGMIGHKTYLYPEMTALENLQFWSSIHNTKTSDAELMAVLERVNLAKFANEKSNTFSRGMSQRLSLARVFAIQSNLLLLDEPGTGLDIASQHVLLNEVLEARKRGAAIVWISHSIEKDMTYADKVAYLEKGKLTFTGTSTEFGSAMPFQATNDIGKAANIPKADAL